MIQMVRVQIDKNPKFTAHYFYIFYRVLFAGF